MMWTVNAALVGCLCACMLALASPCCCDPLGGGGGDVAEAIARPVRPKSFASPDDLRLYLDQLGQYFAVVGRPRFGKRVPSSGARARAVAAREPQPAPYPLSDSDQYDILQYYQQQQE